MFNELTASCVISHETRKDQMYVKWLNNEIFEGLSLQKSLVNHRALDTIVTDNSIACE